MVKACCQGLIYLYVLCCCSLHLHCSVVLPLRSRKPLYSLPIGRCGCGSQKHDYDLLHVHAGMALKIININHGCNSSNYQLWYMNSLFWQKLIVLLLCYLNSFDSSPCIFIYYKKIFIFFCTCHFPTVSRSWVLKNLANPYPDSDPEPYPDSGNLA